MIEFQIDKLHIEVSPYNIKIVDSYKVDNKKYMKECIKKILYIAPIYQTKRSVGSLVREWRAHNVLYKRKWFVSHTKDCDLEAKENILKKIIYFILGIF